MFVDYDDRDKFTADEKKLIAHASRALVDLDYRIGKYRVDALVYPDPLRLDFKAHVSGEIGQAFIGPMEPLTESLFDGDKFTTEFLDKLIFHVEDFRQYLIDYIP